MARLPYADDQSLETLLSGSLARFPRLNTFRMFAHAPNAARAWLTLAQALLGDLALPARWREIGILQVARQTRCGYMAQQHGRLALACGVTQDEIAAIATDRAFGEPDEIADLVRTAARQAVAAHRLAPLTVDALVDRLGQTQAIELILVIGHYQAGAIFLNSLEVDLEA